MENLIEKGKIIQIVGFKLNNEEYALEIENVQEIIKPKIPIVPYLLKNK